MRRDGHSLHPVLRQIAIGEQAVGEKTISPYDLRVDTSTLDIIGEARHSHRVNPRNEFSLHDLRRSWRPETSEKFDIDDVRPPSVAQ